MNFSKMFTICYAEAFAKAEQLANMQVRCKIYKESGVWVVQPNCSEDLTAMNFAQTVIDT